MKKNTISSFLVLISFLYLSTAVYAEVSEIHTVDINGNAKNEFIINTETPYLYLTTNYVKAKFTYLWWIAPGSNDNDYGFLMNTKNPKGSDVNGSWFDFSSFNFKGKIWDDVEKKGTWKVSASSSGKNLTHTTFIVTPEPISASLFLIGAGFLAFNQYKKRSKK